MEIASSRSDSELVAYVVCFKTEQLPTTAVCQTIA
jgi:hypothetical protein